MRLVIVLLVLAGLLFIAAIAVFIVALRRPKEPAAPSARRPMAIMSRNRLFVMALALAVTSGISLVFGMMLLHKDVRTYISGHYHEYSRDADGTRYLCEGSPTQVADTLAGYQHPKARSTSAGTQYLRYTHGIVTIGPDAGHPCSIRVEDWSAR